MGSRRIHNRGRSSAKGPDRAVDKTHQADWKHQQDCFKSALSTIICDTNGTKKCAWGKLYDHTGLSVNDCPGENSPYLEE